MQDPKHSHSRKAWYQRVMEVVGIQWKSNSKSTKAVPSKGSEKLRKSASIATSFSRVCLCAPMASSYNEHYVPPRRSFSYPRSKAMQHLPRISVQPPRRLFRGKSLTEDVLMRRFLLEEEAMMQIRRRNQIDVIRKRTMFTRTNLGPSRLRHMVMAPH